MDTGFAWTPWRSVLLFQVLSAPAYTECRLSHVSMVASQAHRTRCGCLLASGHGIDAPLRGAIYACNSYPGLKPLGASVAREACVEAAGASVRVVSHELWSMTTEHYMHNTIYMRQHGPVGQPHRQNQGRKPLQGVIYLV